MMDRINHSNLRYIKAREEGRQGISMTDVIMTRETIKIGLDQIAEIGEFHLVVGYSVDKIIVTDQDMKRIIEMTLGEEILEEIWEQIRITEERIIEVDIEENIGMRIMKEVGVGLEKDNTETIIEGTK